MGHDGGLLAVGKLDKKERGICVHLMVDFFEGPESVDFPCNFQWDWV